MNVNRMSEVKVKLVGGPWDGYRLTGPSPAPQIMEFGETRSFVYKRVSHEDAPQQTYKYAPELSPATFHSGTVVVNS